RAAMEQRGLDFRFDVEGTPLVVRGDEGRLLQIFVNLLSNAAKYTPRGGHVVFEVEREGEEAVARVADDGLGIRQDMLAGVFELFVQSGRPLDRADGGLGVGLTLGRSLVELHGGRVAARSDGEGQGTELVVRLPLSTDVFSESAPPKREVRVAKGS